MKVHLVQIAKREDLTLYKRVASNGSSAPAWIGGCPPYVVYRGLASYREFDWESDALAFVRDVCAQDERERNKPCPEHAR